MRNFPLQRKLILGGLTAVLLADVTFGDLIMRLSSSRESRQQALSGQSFQISLVKSDVARASKIQRGIPETLKELDEFEGSLLASTKGYSAVTKETDQFAKDAHVQMDD